MTTSSLSNRCAVPKDLFLTGAMYAERDTRNGVHALLFCYVVFVTAIESEAKRQTHSTE